MKRLIPLLVAALFLSSCASFRGRNKYHTAPIAPPSVGEVKGRIGEAAAASAETSRQISAIKRGANRVDYKASRALEYF